MKWRLELVAAITLIIQMLLIFSSWWLKVLSLEAAPLFIAIGILAIGIAGGSIMAALKRTQKKENIPLAKAIRIIGALFATVGVYAVFFPAYSIISHSIVTALLFFTGIFAPWIIQSFIPTRSGERNA